MINSRDLADLDPTARTVCQRHIEGCKNAGVEIMVTSTWRDIEQQDALYKVGRLPGDTRKTVTNAKGGESWHQYKNAWDVVPLVGGKCVWDDMALWDRVISVGEAVGAEAGAKWTSFPDRPHFQVRPGGMSIATALKEFKERGTIFPKQA